MEQHAGKEDNYLVTIIADGMQQQASPIAYFKYARRLPSRSFLLVDRYLRFIDIFVGFRLVCVVVASFCTLKEIKAYQFLDIDISDFY